jgi:hypothetical protein
MIILMGWGVFACYCAVQSLQAAIRLKDPAHQPSVATLDKIIMNLDILADIAVVNLPTREVLRRIKEAQNADLIAAAGGEKKGAGEEAKKDLDARVSQEIKDLLATEAYKASIPTKEMEVLEWEQALFRAAKRAVARSKVPSQRALKLVRTLQRSSKLNIGTSTNFADVKLGVCVSDAYGCFLHATFSCVCRQQRPRTDALGDGILLLHRLAAPQDAAQAPVRHGRRLPRGEERRGQLGRIHVGRHCRVLGLRRAPRTGAKRQEWLRRGH